KNSDLATGNMDDQTFTYDTEQYLYNLMFMRHGYKFTGWKDKNGNSYPVDKPVKNLTNEYNGTVTLYAQWTANDWPVVYTPTEGKCNGKEITDKIKFDSEYIIRNPDGINCTGYEITGWKDYYSNKTYDTGDKLDWGSVGTDHTNSRFIPILDGIDYTISYMCNETSSAKDTQTVTMGEYTDLAQGASLCQKPGYKFTYWSDSDGNTYTSGAQWNTPNNVKLYANYETSTDTTLVYMDGGFEPVSCNAESSKIDFRVLTNTGYEYEGWYICNNETNTPKGCGDPVSSIPAGQCTFTSGNDSGKTMYLYPAMTARTFEIAFKCGDMGSITDAAETMQVTYGQPFTFPKYNTKCDDTGRTFRGWTSGGKEYKAGQTIAEWTDINLMTFNAVWDTVKFTIKFDANGGSGNAPTSISCEYGTIKDSCSAPSYNGMTNGTKYFVGWAYGKDATNPDFEASNSLATAFDTNDTHTLYAVWHECIMPEYDENHVSGIDISVNNNSCQYAAKCKAGYFNPTVSDSWADCTTCPDNSSTSDNNSAKYCTCNTGYEFGTNNQTTTNACSAKEYKIQYGYVNGLDTDNLPTTYKYGVGTKIPSLTKTGYDFIGWCTDSSETDCKKDQQVSDTETGDKTFWAKFKPITFTIWYDPNGGNKPENKAYYTTCTYDEYCETADNVFTKQGYEFKTWNLDKTNNHYSEGQDITNLFNTKSVDHSFYATWAACTSQTAGDCDCDATQHPENGQCLDCLKQCSGEYSDGEYNICNGETAEESCKRDIDKIEIENSIFVNGTITLGGLKVVSNLQCADGYYPSDDKLECLPCMAGHYCPSGQGAQTCPATHPKSSVGAISDDECYQTCSDSEIEGFVYQAASDKEYFDTKCQYSKVVTSVGTCAQDEFDMDARTCNRYETCKPGYRLIAGQCELCGIENAVSYSSGCMVQTCVNGYHPMADSCENNTTECNAENATIATQTWDEKKNRFGVCTIVECDSDYHIENNTCVLNYRACETTNGSGSQEWQSNNTWGNCIADKCDPGFELNGKNCTPCTNGNGVSSWTDGCTIATCMYQGARYNLENNECIEICSETGLTDFTGTRKWNSSTKKCETTCAAGYKSW
ncbi:MAG: InlB B-repeat-containing protein, partial [Alphaproteobacteria bacterium]|nr:InlB B-repeat-containing protein [Alphaproteobacteria bacterium]